MKRLTFLNILILILSVYVLGALLIDSLFELPDETSRLLQVFDFVICIVFFVDFCIQFYQADNKWKFMRWGWIDLVASIPMVDAFRIGRLFGLYESLGLLKPLRVLKNLWTVSS